MKNKFIFLALVQCSFLFAQLPKEFVYVEDVIPSIKVELRYFSNTNFLGKPVDSYKREVAILTVQAAEALKNVQDELKQRNLSIMIYDSYRPQTAVNHFIRWARDLNDTINKQGFYPEVKKQHLFQEGYISSQSGHSRGSTMDITLVDLNTCEPLDMGSPWDFFGPESWVANNNLTVQQRANRMLLQTVMLKHGFRIYTKEWWHFTLINEPFPDTYFDFPVN
ncbi:MAG: peptidase M15 [Bacteroidetes bacterium]|nr:MAG: peptidase M15 [Bacteroidota bacterium]